jgi:hypothetical protein
VEKKKLMRQDHNEKELQDCYAFLYTKVEKEVSLKSLQHKRVMSMQHFEDYESYNRFFYDVFFIILLGLHFQVAYHNFATNPL